MDKEELMEILSNWKIEMMDKFSRKINILGETIGRGEIIEGWKQNLLHRKGKNILIDGIEEKETNLLELENGTIEFIKEKIDNEFNTKQINFIKRIGRPQKGKMRPILISLLSLRIKNILMRSKNKLKEDHQ